MPFDWAELSNRAFQVAASLAYGGWLAVLAIGTSSNFHLQVPLLAPALSVLPGCIGLVLLVIALLRIHINMHHVLPRP